MNAESDRKDRNPSPQTNFAPWADKTQEPLIRFENVTKKYGPFTAIDNLNLDIYEREFFSLLGPSGCGKTTMMRMLAGFETPTSGRILLDGQDLSEIPPHQRSVNMMFQSYALFPHLSVWDNIAFGLRQDKLPKDEVESRTEEMLRMVQLQDFAKRKPHQLSGGQKQRVALARSLAKRPKLLLLDEPLGALDKKLRQQTQFELMDLQEKLGATFVIVTHDQEEAMTVSSRIAVMDKGILRQVDTPGQIYEFPNSCYVADFLGEVNNIEGTVASVNGEEMTLSIGDAQSPIGALCEDKFEQGQTVWLSLRPEKIRIAMEEPEGKDNLLVGKVLDIAYTGNVTTYHVELPSGQIIRTQEANKRQIAERRITWNDKVWLYWSHHDGVVLSQ